MARLSPRFRFPVFIHTFLILLICSCGSSAGDEPDLILMNASVFDGEVLMDGHISLVVSDGRFAFIGDSLTALSMAGKSTETIDLDGKFVIPGLIDAHVHPIGGADERRVVRLSGLKTVEEIGDAIQTYTADHPDMEIIRGRGWELSVFPGGNPSKEMLDRWIPDRPAIMTSWDGHSSWVNTRALEVAGVNSNTPDPENGRIERDSEGEPTGTLRESAMGLVSQIIPQRSQEETTELMREGIRIMNSYGITGFIEASTGESMLEALQSLQNEDRLTARVTASLGLGYTNPKTVSELKAMRDRYKIPDVNTNAVKIFADGVPEAHTAALLEPYSDRPDDRGILNFNPERLDKIVDSLDSEGFQIHFHALGDAGIRYALDALEGTQPANRHHISHLQIIHPDDIPRFAELDVTANFQPFWAQGDDLNLNVIEPIIGPVRSDRMYPIRSVTATGARLAAGSDWPVSTLDPWQAIQVAVTRKQPGVENDKPYKPGEAVDLATILSAYTSGNARLMGLESETGRIREGQSADFVVLDQNLFISSPDSIQFTEVILTYFKGKKIYEK